MTDLSNYTSAVGTELFFRADINGHPLRFGDGDIARTIDGDVYSNLGDLLNISHTVNSIEIARNELIVTISGLSAANIAAVTSSNAKYSPVTLYRAWINPQDDSIIDVQQRYNGYISRIVFEETWDAPDSEFTIALECVNATNRFTNFVSGRRTNDADMKRFFPTDTSFKRVAKITNANFNFGVPNEAPVAGTKS